jgi:hypothetical protein
MPHFKKLNNERLKPFLDGPLARAWAASRTHKFWISLISATMERI